MLNYLIETRNFHDKQFRKFKYSFQREFPNEDIIKNEKKFLKKKSKILDIGSGTGRNAVFLIKKKHVVHCLDFSKEAIILLKKLFKQKKISKKNRIFLDNIPHLKKVSKNYNAVIDCFTSYSLTKKDFITYINNIKQKIKDKGYFHLQILSKNSQLFKKSTQQKLLLEIQL